jgi:hypothetical protein
MGVFGLVAMGTPWPLAQAPHWHVLLHVCVPPEPPPQLWVAFAAHAPCPAQADQADQAPPVQVRVCVPQLPHGCDEGPEQTHAPAAHVDPAPHAWPHEPQLAESVLVLTQAVPHAVSPAPHTQPPHSHALVHVCEPVTSQTCVLPAAQAPWPAQADQADQTPLAHVRVCVPQLPHACDEAPEQTHAPAWHVSPVAHAWPHEPQLAGSVLVLTQAVPHAVAAHVFTHVGLDADAVEHDMPVAQFVEQEPQWVASLSAASQPSDGSPLQSPNPCAQDVDERTHCPEVQLVGPLTWGSFVQSLAHVPHV